MGQLVPRDSEKSLRGIINFCCNRGLFFVFFLNSGHLLGIFLLTPQCRNWSTELHSVRNRGSFVGVQYTHATNYSKCTGLGGGGSFGSVWYCRTPPISRTLCNSWGSFGSVPHRVTPPQHLGLGRN